MRFSNGKKLRKALFFLKKNMFYHIYSKLNIIYTLQSFFKQLQSSLCDAMPEICVHDFLF